MLGEITEYERKLYDMMLQGSPLMCDFADVLRDQLAARLKTEDERDGICLATDTAYRERAEDLLRGVA